MSKFIYIPIEVPEGYEFEDIVFNTTQGKDLAWFCKTTTNGCELESREPPHSIGSKIECQECGGSGKKTRVVDYFSDYKIRGEVYPKSVCPSCQDGKQKVTSCEVVECDNCKDSTGYKQILGCPKCKGSKYLWKVGVNHE